MPPLTWRKRIKSEPGITTFEFCFANAQLHIHGANRVATLFALSSQNLQQLGARGIDTAGRSLASGMYWHRLEAAGMAVTKTMTMRKRTQPPLCGAKSRESQGLIFERTCLSLQGWEQERHMPIPLPKLTKAGSLLFLCLTLYKKN